MADSIVGSVIEHLAYDDDTLRNIALNWLCEGYLEDPAIARSVFHQWDSRSPESAFHQFPMLSYFPVSSEFIDESLQRATSMVQHGAGLTSLTTRCAGKLLEQLVRLPARQLESHYDRVARVAQSHKIFFRVDLAALRNRLSLLSKTAEETCDLLDQSIESLARNPEDSQALRQGEHALEALRLYHPNTLDLTSVLAQATSENQQMLISLQLSLLSLSQFADEQSYETHLATFLHSSNPTLLNLTLESLVRCGSGMAAQMLVEQFPLANKTNRPWIARGLQRMRVHNLAPLIAQLRNQVSDEALWMMLLVAEMQQLDPQSSQRVMEAFDELEAVNPAVIDAGMLFTFVCSPFQEKEHSTDLEECYRDFLLRIQSGLTPTGSSNLGTEPGAALERDQKAFRRHRSKQIEQHFRKRRL